MAAFKPREAIKFRKSIHPEYKDQSQAIPDLAGQWPPKKTNEGPVTF